MTEYSNESASNFALSLNIPLWKLFWWFRRPPLWSASDWQLHHDNVPINALHLKQSFLVKHQITQVTQPCYSPDLVPWKLWIFPKLKLSLKGKRFQTIDEIRENIMGQLMVTGRSVWSSTMPGTGMSGWRAIIVLCTMFLISCIFFNKCLYFSHYMAGYLLDRSQK